MKKQDMKGITLIALVITIIVLLILAGVSIAMLMGPNGLITQSRDARDNTKIADVKESIGLAYSTAFMQNYLTEDEKATVMQSELEKRYGDGNATVELTEEGYVVKIKDEGTYLVDEDGNVEEYEVKEPVEQPEVSEETEFSREYGKIDIEFLKGTSYTIGEANKPQIDSENMIPVNWDGENWVVTDESSWEYSYGDTEETKKWANVMLRDTLILENMTNEQVQTASIGDMKGQKVTQEGSMLVWIPRYAYKITYYETEEKTAGTEIGYSDARGIVDKDGKTPKDMNAPVTSVAVGDNFYRPHPAFEDNSSTNSTRKYSQGEWKTKLQGIWFGKFETTEKVNNKITIRPNQSSYTDYTTIGTFYTDAQNLGIANSHMAKNSEWGAMAYLTESKYGRNGVAVTKNSKATTGDGEYKTNLEQSTTNNIYGIYDTVGGREEYTASYVADSTKSQGNSFASTDGTTNNKEESTEYATVYEMADDDKSNKNYQANINKVFGDGIVETSTNRTDTVHTRGIQPGRHLLA